MDDQTAISRIKQGDLNGLEALVGRYQVKAVYAAYLVLQDRSLAEDVAQDAFLKIYEKIHQFEDGRPFAPWFFRIVVNDAVKTARRQRRLRSLDEEPEAQPEAGDARGAGALAGWMIDPRPLPEEQVEIQETGQMVRRALRKLSPEQRAAVVMRYYLDMSAAEMADQVKKPVTTVKWWLRAARKRLGELVRLPERSRERAERKSPGPKTTGAEEA